jgi:protein phosphatase
MTDHGRPDKDSTLHGTAGPAASEAAPPARPHLEPELAGRSHVGRVREHNEDHFLISRMGRFMDTIETNVPDGCLPARFEETFHGMIVADGVGGGAAGEIASQTAIGVLVQLATTSPNWIFRLDEDRQVRDLLDRLKLRIDQIHEELIRKARAESDLRGFGTTMTIGLNVGGVLFLAHVGDSRVYLLRGGSLQQLTRDHTLSQDLAEQGFTDIQGVPVESLRHVLTRALTDDTRPVRPEVQAVELEDRDRVLFCTDGLSDMVPDPEIAGVLGGDGSSEEIAERLVERALAAGGKDNVTVIVGKYRHV